MGLIININTYVEILNTTIKVAEHDIKLENAK